MKLTYSDYFQKRLKKRITKNPQLKAKVGKQLKILEYDLNYPSLKTHKLQGKRATEHAIWIEKNLRITFIIIKNDILLTDIITHDEY